MTSLVYKIALQNTHSDSLGFHKQGFLYHGKAHFLNNYQVEKNVSTISTL